MSDLKELKKQRLGYERLIRANIQRVEGAFACGNYDQVNHAMVDLKACVKKLDLLARLYQEG